MMCCLLVGCVGHYAQPAAGQPHATLDAVRGDNDLMSGGTQGYYAFYDLHCNDTEETGVLGEASSAQGTHFFVKPNRRIYINAFSMGIKVRKNTNEAIIFKACASAASFIPMEGVTYRMRHSGDGSHCALEVVDTRTGEGPDTLVVEPVTKECGL